MYDELIKALHEGAEFLECSTPGIKNSFAKMCHNAADAIEELQGKAKVLEKLADKWCDAVPKWIPATERLPELNVPCLVYNKYYGPMVGWRIDDKRFRIPGSHLPDHPTHWMPLPEPPKEE